MIDLFGEFDFDTAGIAQMSDEELEQTSDQAFGFLASNLCGDFGTDTWERFNRWYAELQAEQARRAARATG